jgi:hypothetical protein
MVSVPVSRGLSLALVFLPPWAGYLLAGLELINEPPTLRALGVGFMIEFLALHSFAFMSDIAMSRAEWRWAGVVMVMLFSLGFAAAGGLAVVDFRGGWEDLLEWREALKAGYGVLLGWLMFGSAVGFTYLGWIGDPPDRHEMGRLKLRWGVALTLYFLAFVLMALAVELGVPDRKAMPLAGFAYFFALHVLELTRFYELRWVPPRYWNHLPEILRTPSRYRKQALDDDKRLLFWSLAVAACYALLVALVTREPGPAILACALGAMAARNRHVQHGGGMTG